MKSLIFFSCFLLLPIALAQTSTNSLVITRELHPQNVRHKRVLHYFLEKTEAGFNCNTDAVPKHPIKVRGLELNTPPFTVREVKNCDDLISWEKKQYCYKKFDVPILDELFSQCSNI